MQYTSILRAVPHKRQNKGTKSELLELNFVIGLVYLSRHNFAYSIIANNTGTFQYFRAVLFGGKF